MLNRTQFAIRFLGWVLLAIILLLGTNSKAQSNVQVYQCGAFKGQKLRESNISLSFTIIDKYQHKGFNWLLGVNHNTTYAVLIADSVVFSRYERSNLFVGRNVMELCSNQWKRKELKK